MDAFRLFPADSIQVKIKIQVDLSLPLRNTVWCGVDVLQKLQIGSGHIVSLKVDHSKRVAIRLRLYEEDDETEVNAIDKEDAPRIRISSLIAVNAGIPIEHESAETLKSPWMEASLGLFTDDSSPQADSVKLVAWGPSNCNSWNSDARSSWPLPPQHEILQLHSLVAVEADADHHFLYQVVEMNTNTSTQNKTDFLLANKKTRYTVELPPPSRCCPNLPPLHTWKKQPLPPPHPSVPELSEFLQSLASSDQTENRIVHVMGTNREHNVGEAISTASARVGRRYLHVHGLAAHAYASLGKVQDGSLVDQLAGLREALRVAQKIAPAVLHLRDLDLEWSGHGDEELRRDTQARIWNLIVDSLSDTPDTTLTTRQLCVPSVLVVVSTAETAQIGLWKEQLVFGSLKCSRPDRKYIEYLWHDTFIESNTPLAQLSNICGWLEGKSFEDVIQIRQMYKDEYCDGRDSVDETMDKLCSQIRHSRRRHDAPRVPSVHWEDVGGLDHVRKEIMETIEMPLMYPHLLRGLSVGHSGILLYGPPGTGKTLVAKAVATECRIPFLSVKGPELLGSFVGESEGRVREIFEQAHCLATGRACILFFDELDSLAPRRGQQASGGGSVMDRVVATLLSELDRANMVGSNVSNHEESGAVICMAATNRPDMLDPALLRPGRLDRLVYLGLPSGREEQSRVLAAQLRKVRLDDTDTFERDVLSLAREIAEEIPTNLTGADLCTIVSGAQAIAIRRLCDKADREVELRHLRANGDATLICIDDILSTWDDNLLTPVVTLSDLIAASRNIVPSVSLDELERYKELHSRMTTGR